MTARQHLLAVQRFLMLGLVLRAVLTGGAAGLVSFAVAHLVGLAPVESEVAFVVGCVATAAMLPAALRARSLERVALWVEERDPTLHYAVVSLAGGAANHDVERQALGQPWWLRSNRAVVRALAWPAVAAVAALGLVLVASKVAVARGAEAFHPPAARARGITSPVDALARVRVTITPPAYSGERATTLDAPTSVSALVASLIIVSGDGDASHVIATLDSTTRPVVDRKGRWTLAIAMPSRPALVRLRARDGGARERLIVLAPTIDAPPVVTLMLPARDTVMRAATGWLPLRAQLRDDLGLREAHFELVVSSGQDENFTFRATSVAETRLRGGTERTLEGRVSLDSLALKPGDMLQVRAVARDANNVTGPGIGSSDTRTLRVARAGEYDSVSVDPAPPGDPEGQVLSQRMLIMLTEALEKRRPRLARATLIEESRRIAADEARLRKRVGDIVFQRLGGEPLGEESNIESPAGRLTPDELLKRAEAATRGSASDVMDVEGDETPILSLNKPLLEAFNAMWDAGRSLEIGETNRALPAMRRALAAIERARQAERIYLRGRPSAIVVDVAKARLAGKDTGASTEWSARVPIDPVSRRRAVSFAHATELLGTDPAAAADTLLVMRVEALDSAPELASALDDASRLARKGDGAATVFAWQRVRRALGRPPIRGGAGSLWAGAR
jgi:hypothetical protein